VFSQFYPARPSPVNDGFCARTEPTIRFGKEAVVAVPDAFHHCPGAKLIADRDRAGNPGVILNLLLGDRVQIVEG
jgi:hypothetical protein